MSKRQFYTTYEVADILKISYRGACKLFDAEILKGFNVPGSRHRRILKSSLHRFIATHGIEKFLTEIHISRRDVVAICKVSPKVVDTACKRGFITCYKIPGLKYKYIPRSALETFMERRAVPHEYLEDFLRRTYPDYKESIKNPSIVL